MVESSECVETVAPPAVAVPGMAATLTVFTYKLKSELMMITISNHLWYIGLRFPALSATKSNAPPYAAPTQGFRIRRAALELYPRGARAFSHPAGRIHAGEAARSQPGRGALRTTGQAHPPHRGRAR